MVNLTDHSSVVVGFEQACPTLSSLFDYPASLNRIDDLTYGQPLQLQGQIVFDVTAHDGYQNNYAGLPHSPQNMTIVFAGIYPGDAIYFGDIVMTVCSFTHINHTEVVGPCDTTTISTRHCVNGEYGVATCECAGCDGFRTSAASSSWTTGATAAKWQWTWPAYDEARGREKTLGGRDSR